jgi:hypothetical protein
MLVVDASMLSVVSLDLSIEKFLSSDFVQALHFYCNAYKRNVRRLSEVREEKL